MTENKTYKVRILENYGSGEDGKWSTASRDGKTLVDYNTAIEIMNNAKAKNLACFMFEIVEGQKPKMVVQWKPEIEREPEPTMEL